MQQIKDRTGEIYTFPDGRTMKIIEYFTARNISIVFEDGTIIKNKTYKNFRLGKAENLNYPHIFGIGFFGYGEHKYLGENRICYDRWRKMLGRCYGDKELKKRPSYKGCSVHPNWHNFQVFAKWHKENHIEGFELDKDILFKGNKIYGPENCCFVPQEINKILTLNNVNRGRFLIGVCLKKGNKMYNAQININGNPKSLGYFYSEIEAHNAYKTAKEHRIKELANKFKGKITPECYNALMNWTIDIND